MATDTAVTFLPVTEIGRIIINHQPPELAPAYALMLSMAVSIAMLEEEA